MKRSSEHKRPDNSKPVEFDGSEDRFPLRRIILLYSLGAILALIAAFHPTLDTVRAMHCLVLSWILGIAALALSKLEEWAHI